MIPLPLVQRELQMTARRPGTYWVRFAAAGGFMVLMAIMALSIRQKNAQLGQRLFMVLSLLAFGYCLFAGVRYTADCLSQEKREGTLGLLFLTDLRGYDVVLGKLIANGLYAAYSLMAVLPILGLPLLIGSVTGSEFWHMCVLLMNTLVLSLAIGILISAFGLEERQVMMGTFLTLLLLTFGFPALWKLASKLHDSRWFDVLFLFPSPSYGYRMCVDARVRFAVGEFWFCMETIAALSVACIGTASLILPRVFSQKSRSKGSLRWSEFLRQWRFGRRTGRQMIEAMCLRDWRPFYWLIWRDRLPRLIGWIYIVMAVGFGFWMYPVLASNNRPFVMIALFTLFGFHLTLKFLAMCDACRRFSEDRRSGVMELLLVTPLRVNSIVNDQALALQRTFMKPLLALMVLNGLFMMAHLAVARGRIEEEVFIIGIGGAIVAILDLAAIRRVGMWLGLRAATYQRAVVGTLGRVMLPAWLPVLLFIFVGMNGGMSSSTVKGFFLLWLMGCAVYDLLLMSWAHLRLLHEFRRAAARDFEASSQRPASVAAPPVIIRTAY